MPSDAVLQCQNLVKTYQAADDSQISILSDVSFELELGHSMAVVGPSGCGKSTLLNLIGTLDKPNDGKILFDGRDISQMNDKQAAHFRNQELGFIFQEHHLLPQCSVLENVCLPTVAPGSPLSKTEAVSRAKELITQVGLAHRLDHRPAQLSGGERQRVAVARALIHRPKLLLADEPTGSLDRNTASQLADLLEKMVGTHQIAMLVVTHSPTLADQMTACYRLDQGSLVMQSGEKA